jgi:serine/threonine protein kinase
MNFLHLDLKLNNLLISRNFDLKLSDFGLSCDASNCGKFKLNNAGTLNFMSPEHFDSNIKEIPYTEAFKTDYYSLGVILFKMLTDHFPVKIEKNMEVKNKIDELNIILKKLSDPEFFQINYPRGKSITSYEVVKLLKGLLETDIEKRLDLDNIQNYEWPKIKEEEIRNLIEDNENDYLKYLIELDYLKNYIK